MAGSVAGRVPLTLAHGVPAGSMGARCKVLFCTRQFPFGFKFTEDALQNDVDVEVREVLSIACTKDVHGLVRWEQARVQADMHADDS